MDCREFAERFEEFMEGLPAPDLRRAVEAHLAACAGCRGLAELFGGEPDPGGEPAGIDLTRAILARTSGPACDAAEERLCDLVDGSLTDLDADLMALHLEHCAPCRTLKEALGWTAREFAGLAEVDPGPRFLPGVLAATVRRRPAGILGALRDGAERFLLRPRFAFEAAYGGALLLWLLFVGPAAPWRPGPERALALARLNPARAVQAASREIPGWLAPPVARGRRLLAERGAPAIARTRAARAELSARLRRARNLWPDVGDSGDAFLRAAAHGELSESAMRLEEMGARLRSIWRTLLEPERAASPATQEV